MGGSVSSLLSLRNASMATVAVLGTGLLGAGFVRGFRKRGIEALESVGAKAFANAADAVKGVTSVHIVVSDDAAIDSLRVLGSLLVLSSSITLLQPQSRLQRAMPQGLIYIHAPVFMGPDNAENGTGSMLVSCTQQEFDSVHELLKTLTCQVHYMGADRMDRAAAYKLYGNNLVFMLGAAMHDLLAVQIALGLPAAEMLPTVEKLLPPNILAQYVATSMSSADFSKPRFELSMARKDLRLFEETATAAYALPLMITPAIGAQMDKAIKAGHGSEEFLAYGHELNERCRKINPPPTTAPDAGKQ